MDDSAEQGDDFETAAKQWSSLANLDSSGLSQVFLAKDRLLGMGRIANTVGVVESNASRFISDPAYHEQLGDFRTWLASFDEAANAYARAYELHPTKELAAKKANTQATIDHRARIRNRTAELGRLIRSRIGDRVLSGPFRQMIYSSQLEFAWLAHLLGCYEEELHLPIEWFVARQPKLIINIGAASGYYAVGLAKRCPDSQVYAYEVDAEMREECRKLSVKNALDDRIFIHERFEVGDFEALDGSMRRGRTLIVCDCEGCEMDLLRPNVAPALRFADLIVECHDHLIAGVSERLLRRFHSTHRITVVSTVPNECRAAERYACLAGLNAEEKLLAVNDLRGINMLWLLMTPRE